MELDTTGQMTILPIVHPRSDGDGAPNSTPVRTSATKDKVQEKNVVASASLLDTKPFLGRAKRNEQRLSAQLSWLLS
jgi:hypothetical protein